MSTFEAREQTFEKKFALDEEQAFKAAARRDKLIGLWAAGLLGLTGEAANDYAKSVVIADMEEAGDDDVVRKLVTDLGDKSNKAEITAKLAGFAAEAAMQIKAGK